MKLKDHPPVLQRSLSFHGFVVSMVSMALMMVLAACGGREAPQVAIEKPADVLAAMKQAYDGAWYERLTFVQTTIQYAEDGASDTTTWFEAMELPGKLRIDIGEPNSGDMWLFRNDSFYVYTDGFLSAARPTFHPLLLLGFDVYFLDTVSLLNRLDSLQFDVSTLSDTTWQDRDVWVIGADAGDAAAQQFWVDKERLYFVRLLQKVGDGTMQQDVRFNNYEPLEGGWIAPEVEFYVDGRLQMAETYHLISVPSSFDRQFFSPSAWQEAEHWYRR